MRITKDSWLKVRKLPLAIALAGAATSATATEFNFGDMAVQWDNTISYGVAWRTEAPDANAVASGNASAMGFEGKGSSYNYDDGTLNYAENEIYTNVVKYSTDIEINYKNYGGFFRAKAFYDTEIMDGEREFKELNDATKDAAGKGYDLLDAFVWADYDFGDTPASFRIGRQVISWGESTFIQGGINSINPVDASAFRRPGAEVKEGLLPVNMFYTSIGLTADLSLEAFYQLEWEKTRSDPCGTFFSTVDFAADGCGPVLLAGTDDERNYLAQRDAEISQGGNLADRISPATERLADQEARDDGQYGLALRWYAEALGDTEFGLYYMNIHSRLPFINGAITNYDTLGLVTGTQSGQINSEATYDNRYPLYQMVYPEDQKLMGLSFATSTEGGASIGGEISYRPDAPIQWNAFELILAGLALPSSRLYQDRLAEIGGITATDPSHQNAASLAGETLEGYDNMDIWQAQMTYIKFFDQVLGADRLALAAEIGATYIPDLPDVDDARYGRSGAYGIGDAAGVDAGYAAFQGAAGGTGTVDPCLTGYGATSSGANANTSNCTDEGYVTQLSGGVRLRAGIDYNNAFAGVNMTPNIAISYDKGNGPEPGAQFIDERLTTALGVKFVYQNQTQVTVSYTNFEGGDYNTTKDRDNIALAASYSF
ncbi:MAG: DUF1302 domain-containing protein [Oleispira sp.]|nr:DUF1302 domain-containing protein [Oleispira sp.]